MKNKPGFYLIMILLIFCTLNLNSCSRTADTVSCFPNTPINVVLNLNLPAYYPLQISGGWIYVDEQSPGSRGLIVVRTGNGFMVYDRNAPHLCPDNDTTLVVENNIRIVCPKDGAEWILITGEPIKTAKVPPKIYPYDYQPGTNILSIFY
ncbi:Rieske (2Fe-2S) protein [Chryseobacterium lacus]|uniref:hypothetical protein n=1 Tax=Chryseobacterium lacus TaxID=2058346 RepID=UPI00086C67C0|nr:hypothetical protein [Chryseobacterium lacus]ODS83924.1 MAG: hypothetical protein ABS44_16960 [Chryseobacterium sp. SCN 40-13]RST25712.1 hypothetical protein EIZ46_09945 [Chryseobacterium lacus]